MLQSKKPTGDHVLQRVQKKNADAETGEEAADLISSVQSSCKNLLSSKTKKLYR